MTDRKFFEVHFAAFGKINGQPVVYREVANVSVNVPEARVIAKGKFVDNGYRLIQDDVFHRDANGTVFHPVKIGAYPDKDKPFMTERRFKEAMCWAHKQGVTTLEHPIWAIHDASRSSEHHLRDRFIPPNWERFPGEKQHETSPIYDGLDLVRGAVEHWPMPAIEHLDWLNDRSIRAPMTVRQIEEYGVTIEPEDTTSIVAALQKSLDDNFALIDGNFVRSAPEPVLRVSVEPTRQGRVIVDVTHDKHDFQFRQKTDPIEIFFRLDDLEQATEAASLLAEFTGKETRTRGEVTFIDPSGLEVDGPGKTARGLLHRLAQTAYKAAADLPTELARQIPDLDAATPEWWQDDKVDFIRALAPFRSAVGGNLSMSAGDSPWFRRLATMMEALRLGYDRDLTPHHDPIKAAEQDENTPGAELTQAALVHLPVAGRSFNEAWCNLVDAVRDNPDLVASAATDLGEVVPDQYASEPSRRKYEAALAQAVNVGFGMRP